jgi:dTDP-4-dehydrorhamnose reductase
MTNTAVTPTRQTRRRRAIAIVGVDGYLGQFVLDWWLKRCAGDDDDDEDATTTTTTTTTTTVDAPTVAFACGRRGQPSSSTSTSTSSSSSSSTRWINLNLTDEASCENAMKEMIESSDVVLSHVVNCAAMSSPGACEKDPETALAVNAPRALWRAAKKYSEAMGERPPFWIQLSSDHVYEGTRALSTERDECNPVNAYGKTKVECERALCEDYGNRSVTLRSSIITGPKPPLRDVDRTLFLDFVASSFDKEQPTSFYDDEFRNPISAFDVVRVIRELIFEDAPTPQRVYNMGGPDRVNRVDMANAVARHLAAGDVEKEARFKTKIQTASCVSAQKERGVAAPPDISMDSSALAREVLRNRWAPRSFEAQVVDAFKV